MHILSWEVLSDLFKCCFQLSAIVLVDEGLPFLTFFFFLLGTEFLSGSLCPPHLLEGSCLVSGVCAQCVCVCACVAREFFCFSSFMEYIPLICMS